MVYFLEVVVVFIFELGGVLKMILRFYYNRLEKRVAFRQPLKEPRHLGKMRERHDSFIHRDKLEEGRRRTKIEKYIDDIF